MPFAPPVDTHGHAVRGTALAINDRVTATMYMLAAARWCLAGYSNESVLFDDSDYEAALVASVRGVSEQMHRRGGLRPDRARDLAEAAMIEMREAIPAEPSEEFDDAVHTAAIAKAAKFWSGASDADCARIAAAVSQPAPVAGELAPAAFAELVLSAGSAAGWESLTEAEHAEVLDSDGNRGGCRWDEVRVDLATLPHQGLGLTRGAEELPSYMDTEIPADEIDPVNGPDMDPSLAAGMRPGLEVVIDVVDGRALYETRIPSDPHKAPTRTRVNPIHFRNDAATEVLLHLLVAGDASTQHPAALPADATGGTILGSALTPATCVERLGTSAHLVLQAHMLLHRSGGRARSTGRAATAATIPESAQPVSQLMMEMCIAAGFAWRWISRILACWNDPTARGDALSQEGHLLAGHVTDAAVGCVGGQLNDNDQIDVDTLTMLAQTIADGVTKIIWDSITGLWALYGLAEPGPPPITTVSPPMDHRPVGNRAARRRNARRRR